MKTRSSAEGKVGGCKSVFSPMLRFSCMPLVRTELHVIDGHGTSIDTRIKRP
jgi:hypothetical protein